MFTETTSLKNELNIIKKLMNNAEYFTRKTLFHILLVSISELYVGLLETYLLPFQDNLSPEISPNIFLSTRQVPCTRSRNKIWLDKGDFFCRTCSNMYNTCVYGSKKFNLLVIGKNQKSKVFQRYKVVRLEVHHHFNKKAWMTNEIFVNWLLKLDQHMSMKQKDT